MYQLVTKTMKNHYPPRTLNSEQRTQTGFTLIEILVVIVIIGILSTIGLGAFRSSQVKSRDARRRADLRHVAEALEAYYNDEGRYPVEADFQALLDTPNSDFTHTSGTVYMVDVPVDPGKSTQTNYDYVTDAQGTYYRLYARLENELDSEVDVDGYTGTDCGGSETVCNFGVASSNTSL